MGDPGSGRGLRLGVSLYGEVMGNGHMGPNVDRQTGLKTLPSPLCRWMVTMVTRQSFKSPNILNGRKQKRVDTSAV